VQLLIHQLRFLSVVHVSVSAEDLTHCSVLELYTPFALLFEVCIFVWDHDSVELAYFWFDEARFSLEAFEFACGV
jgi:hypothetical protein